MASYDAGSLQRMLFLRWRARAAAASGAGVDRDHVAEVVVGIGSKDMIDGEAGHVHGIALLKP